MWSLLESIAAYRTWHHLPSTSSRSTSHLGCSFHIRVNRTARSPLAGLNSDGILVASDGGLRMGDALVVEASRWGEGLSDTTLCVKTLSQGHFLLAAPQYSASKYVHVVCL